MIPEWPPLQRTTTLVSQPHWLLVPSCWFRKVSGSNCSHPISSRGHWVGGLKTKHNLAYKADGKPRRSKCTCVADWMSTLALAASAFGRRGAQQPSASEKRQSTDCIARVWVQFEHKLAWRNIGVMKSTWFSCNWLGFISSCKSCKYLIRGSFQSVACSFSWTTWVPHVGYRPDIRGWDALMCLPDFWFWFHCNSIHDTNVNLCVCAKAGANLPKKGIIEQMGLIDFLENTSIRMAFWESFAQQLSSIIRS